MKFQEGITSITNNFFNDQYVLVFDLKSMQNATERCLYTEQTGHRLSIEMNLTLPLENVTEVFHRENGCIQWQSSNLVSLQKIFDLDNVSLRQKLTAFQSSSSGMIVLICAIYYHIHPMIHLPLSTGSPARSRASIGLWRQNFTIIPLPIHSIAKITVSWGSNSTSGSFQNGFRNFSASVDSTRSMQLSFSSSLDRKK